MLTRRFAFVALAPLALLAACSDDGSSSASTSTVSTTASVAPSVAPSASSPSTTTVPTTAASTTSTAPPTTAAPSTTAAPGVLHILVSNDDGVEAPGIAALVDALQALPNVEITVVAPAVNQSGTGGKTTPGTLVVAPATMVNGFAATAVAGYPADSVNYAFDVLGLHPDVVVAGTNHGQNLGPIVDVSGTVGAARAGNRHGVPSIAVSQGAGEPPAYAVSAKFAADWLQAHRGDLAAATAGQVVNINVPTCAQGEPGPLTSVPVATDIGGRHVLAGGVDCALARDQPPTDDIDGFNHGFGVISLVPAEPAA